MNSLVLATRNLKKQKEMQELVEGFGWQVLTLREFPDCPEVIEDGETFLDNARKKALEVSRHTGLTALADDSGLEVDALDGAPGVYSARYAHGEGSSDEENLQRVLSELQDIPDGQRTGRFVCTAALAHQERILFTTRQTVEGNIIREPRGHDGFGYDPIFFYPPFGKTLAQMASSEKHTISHRGKAMRDVLDFLKTMTSDARR